LRAGSGFEKGLQKWGQVFQKWGQVFNLLRKVGRFSAGQRKWGQVFNLPRKSGKVFNLPRKSGGRFLTCPEKVGAGF
jgi:hypothetical protein